MTTSWRYIEDDSEELLRDDQPNWYNTIIGYINDREYIIDDNYSMTKYRNDIL